MNVKFLPPCPHQRARCHALATLSLLSPPSLPRSFVLVSPRPASSPTACRVSVAPARGRLSLRSVGSFARSGSARAGAFSALPMRGVPRLEAPLRSAAPAASVATLPCSLWSPARGCGSCPAGRPALSSWLLAASFGAREGAPWVWRRGCWRRRSVRLPSSVFLGVRSRPSSACPAGCAGGVLSPRYARLLAPQIANSSLQNDPFAACAAFVHNI